MAIDHQLAASERHEAIRKRIQTEEWADRAMAELTKTSANLSQLLPTSATKDSVEKQIRYMLSLCDTLATAGEVGAAGEQVVRNERKECIKKKEVLKNEIGTQQNKIEELRKEIEEEKLLYRRMDGYDALARVILKEPSCEESKVLLEERMQAYQKVDNQVNGLVHVEDIMGKEVSLLLQCADSLLDESTRLATMITGIEGDEHDVIVVDYDRDDTLAEGEIIDLMDTSG